MGLKRRQFLRSRILRKSVPAGVAGTLFRKFWAVDIVLTTRRRLIGLL